MIKIPITEEDKNAVRLKYLQVGDQIKHCGLKSRFNTNYEENNKIGMLGELLFKKFLDTQGMQYQTDDVVGRADKYDFLIRGKRVDLKTALRIMPMTDLKDNYKLFLQKHQLGLHGDVYVWIFVNGRDFDHAENAFIIGYMRAEAIKEYPINEQFASPAYAIPVGEVNPPELIKFIGV